MLRVERRPGERDGLRLERFQGLGERFGRAKRRGGGVVQIVRQPGGDFPQAGQFLLLLCDPLVVLEAPGRRLDELENHRRADAEHFLEGLRGEPEQAGGPVAAHGGDGRVAAQERDLADEVPGRVQDGQPDLLSGRLPGDFQLPIEQDVEGLSLPPFPPFLDQRFARRERDLLAMPRQPRNLLGRQIGEEREASQLDFQVHGRTSMGTREQGLTYKWIGTPPTSRRVRRRVRIVRSGVSLHPRRRREGPPPSGACPVSAPGKRRSSTSLPRWGPRGRQSPTGPFRGRKARRTPSR